MQIPTSTGIIDIVSGHSVAVGLDAEHFEKDIFWGELPPETQQELVGAIEQVQEIGDRVLRLLC